MKPKYFILILFILSNACFAQQRADSLVVAYLIKVFQNDKVLLQDDEINCTKDCLWDDKTWIDKINFLSTVAGKKEDILYKNQKFLNSLLYDYNIPPFCRGKYVKYQFLNKSVSILGSLIVRDSNVTSLNLKAIPELPFSSRGKQLFTIVDPKSGLSNYKLNFNSENVLRKKSKSTAEIDLPSIAKAKLEELREEENSNKTTLNFAVGTFKNRLASLFEDLRDDKISINNFSPMTDIFFLWTNNETLKENDKVINYFDGACFYYKKGISSTDEQQFSVDVDASGKLGFLSLAGNFSSDWSSDRKKISEFETHDVFVFDSLPHLISIPTPYEIRKRWQILSNLITEPFTQKTYTITDEGQYTEVKLVFGPISPEYVPLIRIDTQYTKSMLTGNQKFIGKIVLVNDYASQTNYNIEKSTFEIPVRIFRDEDFIRNYTGSITTFNTHLKIRLYIDKPFKDTLYLEKYYDRIKVETPNKPNLSLDENRILSENKPTYYLFTANGSIETERNSPIVNNNRNKIIPDSTKQDSIEHYSSFSVYNNNRFKIETRVPLGSSLFLNRREVEHEFTLSLNDSRGEYKRRILVTYVAPEEDVKRFATITGSVPFDNIMDALHSIDTSKSSSFGINFSALSTATRTDSVEIFTRFAKATDVKFTKEGNYLINESLINKSKIFNREQP